MKLVHVSVQVQYTDPVEAILAGQGLRVWARYGRIAGRDCDGRHEGSQAFPGNLTVIQAQVPDARVDAVLDALQEFRRAKRAHRHLEALVLPIERKIGAIREVGDRLEDDREEPVSGAASGSSSGAGPDPETGPGAAGRALALGLALLLPLLAGCSARPWDDLALGGPPGPRPIELPEPPEPSELGAAPTLDQAPDRSPAPATEEVAGGTEEAVEGERRVRLSRDAALVTAILNNPGLEVTRFGPRIAGMAVPEALAAFDPRLTGTASYEDATRQLTAVQSFTFRDGEGGGGDGDGQPQPAVPFFLDRQSLNVTGTLSTLFPTGTGLAFEGVVDRTDTNFTPREYEGSWTVEVRQPLREGRGKAVNLIALRQAKNRAVQSEWQVRRAVLDLVAGVERAYWDLVLAQEVVGIREFGVRLAGEQLALNEDLVDTGRAVRSAALSARAERASRRADLADAEGRVRSLTVGLLRLLNPGSTGRIDGRTVLDAVDAPRVERLPVDVEASVREALERRPEVFRDRIETLNRRLDVVAAEDALKPEIDLVAAYGRSSLGLELG
ncbi:MAG: TolC family protein, partial [Acidobacteriota bacterium]